MISTLRNGLLVLLAMLPLVAGAVTGKSAHDLIQDSTSELLSDLAAHRAQYRANPDAFFTALNRIIGPAVDAEGISRSIMTIAIPGDGPDIYPHLGLFGLGHCGLAGVFVLSCVTATAHPAAATPTPMIMSRTKCA